MGFFLFAYDRLRSNLENYRKGRIFMSDEEILEQLLTMYSHEDNPFEEGHGAQFVHWYGDAQPVQLDGDAIYCLVQHYAARVQLAKRDKQLSVKGIV